MLTFAWNALRVGDHVLVHDPGSAELALVPGTVVIIDTRRGANGVGIRILGADGEAKVLWPARLTVHSDPRDPTEACWRCQALDRAAATSA